MNHSRLQLAFESLGARARLCGLARPLLSGNGRLQFDVVEGSDGDALFEIRFDRRHDPEITILDVWDEAGLALIVIDGDRYLCGRHGASWRIQRIETGRAADWIGDALEHLEAPLVS